MKLILYGPIRGGKNNMGVSRTGKHFPRADYVAWRQQAEAQIRSQIPFMQTLTQPVKIAIRYWPADRRRRDVPAILDSLWHILERMRIVKDDAIIQAVDYEQKPMAFSADGKPVGKCEMTINRILTADAESGTKEKS